jgi:hypothetical protein
MACPDEVAHQLAGRAVVAPPRAKACSSSCSCNSTPASGPPGKSCSGLMPTTIPALALRSLREYWLMPLVTTRPGFGGGRHHGAARAHAETVNGAAIAGMVHQLVVGRAQRGMTRVLAQPRLVDLGLRMLDAKADGERAWARRKTPRRCSMRKVSRGTVSQRQHHMAAVQHFAAGQPARLRSGHLRISRSLDPAFETHLAAQRDDLLAHRRHHAGQAEGADMRLADVEDLPGRRPDELMHHLAAVELRVLDLAVQLAVGEQPRAALAELHVGLRRQVFLRHSAQVSLVRWRTSLPRSSTMGRKPICASSSAANRPQGPKPITSGRSLQACGRLRHGVVGRVGRRCHVAVTGQTREHRRFIAQSNIQDVDEADLAVLLAGIVTAFEDAEIQQLCRGNAQARQDGGAQCVGRMAKGQGEFGDADHGRHLAGDAGRGNGWPALYT